MLEELCFKVVSGSEIEFSEIADKEAFRQRIEHLSREVITMYEIQENGKGQFPPQSVELKCFGSLSSGFATKASDMDLGLVTPLSAVQPDTPDSPIPRLLEKALLNAGFGARLLTRTRVPIIKLCERPPAKLLEDLLAEREKWETGASKDTQDGQDRAPVGEDVPSADEDEDHEPQQTEDDIAPEFYFDVPSIDGNGGVKRMWLKQSRNQTLANYQITAKRVLRKAGGRDVTAGNHRELSELEWEILNCVCNAFIQGLENIELRDALRQWSSLTFEHTPGSSNRHSLMTVCTQVEGEELLQRWDQKIAQQGMSTKPRHGHAVMQWNHLRSREMFGLDPLAWAKEVQLALGMVKKLPSVQLITLEQQPHETPTQYNIRARSVVRVLADHNQEPTHVLLAQYIAGIQPSSVRKAVTKAFEDSSYTMDMVAIGRRHKSFHLATKLEQALAKKLYEESQVSDIKSYVELLRQPLVNISNESAASNWIVPIGPENAALVARIQGITDPQTFAVNQPRDRYKDKLEFPKSGVGAQCDINFSAHLALQNTLLLRCYSHTDPRVRPMVLFIKHWAKVRGINSGYRGTLSSYGYVLMVLHYLVNVAQPFVCPNLQQLAPPPPPDMNPSEMEGIYTCRGYDVRFWRNEEEILHLSRANQLTPNKESIGHLLRGFFEYYAHTSVMSDGTGRGFDWGRDVLSLRTPGGLLSKQEKGWTGAKTTVESRGPAHGPKHSQSMDVASPASPMTPQQPQGPTTAVDTSAAMKANAGGEAKEVKEVRHRYLFAIEDPFELDHNVARTVTHNGIVSIRDEFRRAWRILRAAGQGFVKEDLLQDANAAEQSGKSPFLALLDDIHGIMT
jgi:terminal uridylyltransferase